MGRLSRVGAITDMKSCRRIVRGRQYAGPPLIGTVVEVEGDDVRSRRQRQTEDCDGGENDSEQIMKLHFVSPDFLRL